MNNTFCTIFTPTYNREDCLINLYDSLIRQTDQDFEWLIIDDGSIDNTEVLINKLILKNEICIRYFKVKNGGKHRAINKGIRLAKGKVFAIVDSDDYLTDDAVEKIKYWFKSIEKEEKKYAGVAGAKGYSDDKMVGTGFSDNCIYIDAKNTERMQNGIRGDKFEVFYTAVLIMYPFPEIDNEKFITEQVVWTRIAKDGYYLRWYNDIIYICDYLDGGLTSSRISLAKKNPKGYAIYIQQELEYGNLTLKQKLGYISFYYKIRSEFISLSKASKEIKVNKLLMLCAYILRLASYKIRGVNDE